MQKMMMAGLVMAGVAAVASVEAMAQTPSASGVVRASATAVPEKVVVVVPASGTQPELRVSGTVARTPEQLATAMKATFTKEQALTVTTDDRVEGSMMAPVTVIEYASLTCSHCADFFKETYPQFRKEWIETGKAKYVLRDMPWDNLALGMAKVVHCVPAPQFSPLVKSFYAQQMKIITASDPLAEIKNVAKMAGLSDAQVDSCIKDPGVHAKVTAVKDVGFNVLQVRGTPTFFINGTVVNGAVPYKDLKKTLDAEYAKAKK